MTQTILHILYSFQQSPDGLPVELWRASRTADGFQEDSTATSDPYAPSNLGPNGSEKCRGYKDAELATTPSHPLLLASILLAPCVGRHAVGTWSA